MAIGKAGLFVVTVTMLLTSGCAHKLVDQTGIKAEGEKVIIVSGPRTAWLTALEQHIKQKGFTVKRYGSQEAKIETAKDGSTSVYQQAAARYELNVDGHDIIGRRCFGGGWTMREISAEMVDLKTNEVVFSYSNSGYTENCPPLSGTLFGDIANLVAESWR